MKRILVIGAALGLVVTGGAFIISFLRPSGGAVEPLKVAASLVHDAKSKLTTLATPEAPATPAPAPAQGVRTGTAKVNPADLTAAFILSVDTHPNAREEAIYQLTQSGMPALPELRKILATPLPKDLSRRDFEVSLRITALEAIDNLGAQGADVSEALSNALKTYDDPSLQTLTMIGLQGLEENRPGKISRFINEMVDR